MRPEILFLMTNDQIPQQSQTTINRAKLTQIENYKRKFQNLHFPLEQKIIQKENQTQSNF